MCGILVTSGSTSFSHRDLASLRARGPDAVGFWSSGDVGIGQTRLAVIGLDDRGDGPFENATHVLAFNGEIYNFEAIRRRLGQEFDLSEANDGEVLLHAWSRWGKAILRDLEGFWAFVVYDKQAHTFTLVRDQLGIKPLYFSINDSTITIASTIRTILQGRSTALEINYEALSEYTAYQFTFGDKTFLSGITRVQPGHCVDIDLHNHRVHDSLYEDILQTSAGDPGRDIDTEWIHETRELLVHCISSSTIGDTPFTSLCSGGIDSSLVTRVSAPEVAYHCNYSDPDCNETFFAKQAVEGSPTRLFVVNAIENFDLVSRLRDIIEDFDDPAIGSVVLPLDDLLAQVKRRYKVMLLGTGGDELFAGYMRYQLALGECHQDSYRGMFESMSHLTTVADRFEHSHRKSSGVHYRFYDPEVGITFRKAFESCRHSGDDTGAMLTFDRRYFLPGLLSIDDRMAGRHSLEGRPSLLHQRFVRHVVGVDPSALLDGPGLKWALREVAAPLIPSSIAQRADKVGFATPIGTFARHSSDRIRQQLNGSAFRELYDLKGLNFAPENKFSREVFGLLMLDLWLNRYAT